MSPDGPGTIARYYNGSSFNPLEELLNEEVKKVEKFIENHILKK